MYFITTKRMLEVCFSAHPNIQYRTRKVKMEEFTVDPRRQTAAGLFSSYLNPGDSIVMNTARWSGHPQRVRQS